MLKVDKEEAKKIQKYFIMNIELLIDRMRYDKLVTISIGDLLNVKDSIKDKRFIKALMKEK